VHRVSKKTRIILALGFYLPFSISIALPILSITPQDYAYHDHAVAKGSRITVSYTVTNLSILTLIDFGVSGLPSEISATMCQELDPGESCTLTFTVPAELTSTSSIIQSPFYVCVNSYKRCIKVEDKYQLDIGVLDNDTFIAISDMHVGIGNKSNIVYGQDTGFNLWQASLDELSSLIDSQAPKFILLAGDLPQHADRSKLQTNIAAVLGNISGLPAIVNNNIPVFYAFGNNDSLVSNYGPYYDGKHNLFYLDPDHESPAVKGWPTLNANPDCAVSPHFACTYTSTSPMPPEHASDMANVATGDGYYSAYPLGSEVPLRLISLNSVLFTRHIFYGCDPVKQQDSVQAEMQWLSEQLAQANANNESVYILMHIPVGKDAFYNHGGDMWNNTLFIDNIPNAGDHLLFRDAFLALTTFYKSTIRAIISAHTHENELRALYPDQHLMQMDILDVGLPGITPNHFTNPGMQVYLYDRSFKLTEAKTFYTTPIPGTWTAYSFQNDYHCEKNSSMFDCVSTKILPKLPFWKKQAQPIAGNAYQINYSVKNQTYSQNTNTWLAILDAMQVVPIVGN